jgi:protein-S-isoprenylcysteine O-methyltransferase Ste14
MERPMNTTARYVALLTVVCAPPMLLFWFLIHPFAGRWRKFGPVVTYLTVVPVLIMTGIVIFGLRNSLLRVHFGVHCPLIFPAVILLLSGVSIAVSRARHLSFSVLMGMPEVSGRDGPGRLVTGGIYGLIRHPRYVEGFLYLASIALFTNYLAVYLLLVAYIPMVYMIVFLEERELGDRFGEEYRRYCSEVPRFVPKVRRNKL